MIQYKTIKMESYKTLGKYLQSIKWYQSRGWRVAQIMNGCTYHESIQFYKYADKIFTTMPYMVDILKNEHNLASDYLCHANDPSFVKYPDRTKIIELVNYLIRYRQV